MGFDALVGNETLKQRLVSAFANAQPSHCYLITGPVGSGKRTLAGLLMAAMQCTAQEKPCCQCAQCRKVLNSQHPDVITVDDPERVTLPIKLIRDACADLYIRPNEGKKKIYLFPRGNALRPDSQNALLKCIEEPPSYGVFIFLCEHSERMLPTVRSRCVELRMSPLTEAALQRKLREAFPAATEQAIKGAIARSGGYLGQAISAIQEGEELLPQSEAFLEAYCSGDKTAMLRVLTPMEKLKRDQLRPILTQWSLLLASALSAHNGLPSVRPECDRIAAVRSTSALLAAIDAVKQAQCLLEANVGTAHICGALAIRLQ